MNLEFNPEAGAHMKEEESHQGGVVYKQNEDEESKK